MSDREPARRQPASMNGRTPCRPDVPVLPLRDTVLFPNSFMPLAVARESSVKLIDEAIAGGKVIGVFTQRDPTHEEPGAGRSVPDRHAHAHPQDVQAARRQPAADRAGPRAHPARRASSTHAAVPARRGRRGRRRARETRRARDRRARSATSARTSSRSSSCRPVLSDDLTTLAANITEPGRLADFIASSLSTIGTGAKQELLGDARRARAAWTSSTGS